MGRKKKSPEFRKLSMEWRRTYEDVKDQLKKYYPYIHNLIRIGNQLQQNINRWSYDATVLEDPNNTILDMMDALQEEDKNKFTHEFTLLVLNIREYQEIMIGQLKVVMDTERALKEKSGHLRTEEQIMDFLTILTDEIMFPLTTIVDDINSGVKLLIPVLDKYRDNLIRTFGEDKVKEIEDIVSSVDKAEVDIHEQIVKDIVNTDFDELLKVPEDNNEVTTLEEPEVVIPEIVEDKT